MKALTAERLNKLLARQTAMLAEKEKAQELHRKDDRRKAATPRR